MKKSYLIPGKSDRETLKKFLNNLQTFDKSYKSSDIYKYLDCILKSKIIIDYIYKPASFRLDITFYTEKAPNTFESVLQVLIKRYITLEEVLKDPKKYNSFKSGKSYHEFIKSRSNSLIALKFVIIYLLKKYRTNFPLVYVNNIPYNKF